MRNKIYFFSMFFCLFSCDMGEIPVPPHETGDVLISEIEMGEDYRYQSFFNLFNNQIVSQNIKTDWDLAFENSIEGWRIFLNSSKGGAAWKISDEGFQNIPEINFANWEWDSPNGDIDSNAIGDYRNQSNHYVIDRGYDYEGNHLGYRKIRIESVDSYGYSLRYASLDNGFDTIVWVAKDQNVAKTCFSFQTHKVISIQPTSDNWDLFFTQYTNLFYNPLTPYLVAGVLTNYPHVIVAVDTINDFSTISYDMIESYDFSEAQDMIGYNWKTYNYQSGTFSINADINYIIKDVNERYFKLHFIDFYNSDGVKGYPKFEYQEL